MCAGSRAARGINAAEGDLFYGFNERHTPVTIGALGKPRFQPCSQNDAPLLPSDSDAGRWAWRAGHLPTRMESVRPRPLRCPKGTEDDSSWRSLRFRFLVTRLFPNELA